MTQHDPEVRIRHMRDHAQEAIEMLGDKALDQLQSDRMLQLALVQLIEIVGEAASRISDDVRQAYPTVPWQLAADMRNKLIHGYDVTRSTTICRHWCRSFTRFCRKTDSGPNRPSSHPRHHFRVSHPSRRGVAKNRIW